ncbi:MAG: ABC transporter permease [Pirellulales bacterium]
MNLESTTSELKHKWLAHLSDVSVQVGVMFALLVGLVLLTGWWDPNFFTPYSRHSVLRDTAVWSLFALGQAVVIIGGGIDLSVGSLIAFFGVLTILMLNSGLPFPLVVLLILLLAAAIGAIHGSLICGLHLQPFLVTLCSLLIFRGLARVITHDKTVSFNSSQQELFRELATGSWGGLPIPVLILAGVLVPLGLLMHGTVPGRYIYAMGYNLEAARFSGVQVNLLRTFCYALCSVLTAMAALLETGDVGSVSPSSAGLAYEMYGITGAVLGGCALRGGQGSLIGVVIGMTILRVIKSAVVFLNFDTYWTFTVTGLVLLAAVIIDSVVRGRRTGYRH